MVSTGRSKHRRRTVPSAAKTPDSCLSSPRSSSTSTSSSGSGCSLAAATACAQLSPSFRCLEQISLDMSVDEEKSEGSRPATQAVFFVLHVRHAKSGVAWSHRVGFDHYHTFHKKLLEMLKQGHTCRGDCPWLYSFLKSYFPKSSSCPFKIFCPKVIAKRREALLQCFTTLHSFLLTRENQSCDVLNTSVLRAFTALVYGELGPSHPLMVALKINEQLAGKSTGGESAPVSSYSSTEEEDDVSTIANSQSSSESAAPMCPLCRNRLNEDAGEAISSPTQQPLMGQPRSASSGSATTRYYATRLRCGHEFHEECILQWFNHELSCPACGRSELSPKRSSARSSSGVEAFPE